jgi:hypothetical protein
MVSDATKMIGWFKYNWKYNHDKFDHGFIGYISGNVSGEVCQRLGFVLIALLIPVFLGLGKELYDKFVKKEKFDIIDWAATSIAGVVGVGVSVL